MNDTQIQVSLYKTRKELESHIQRVIGTDISQNQTSGYQIVGTREELQKLNLSEKSSVFGVPCVVTN